VRGDELFVTRFRAAQLLVLNKDGVLRETRTPRSFGHDEQRFVMEEGANAACGSTVPQTVHVESTPNVAWRTIDVPGSGVTMLHQRSRTDEIQVTVGGYGSGSCGAGIVQTSVTAGLDSQNAPTGDLLEVTLGVDIAADSEGTMLAVAAPGNQGSLPQVQIVQLTQLQGTADVATPADADAGVAFPTAGSFASPMVPGKDFAPCMQGTVALEPQGQVTAVSFASPYVLAVQEREPAAISFYDLRTQAMRSRVELGGDSRFDTGHAIFHMRAGAGLACASCHPEAGDDGHVWTFATIGARRTQALRGGILGTEPLHWNGDMDDFQKLVKEVFVGRMSGFSPSSDQSDALSHWIDLQPSLSANAADNAAAVRGKELFESNEVRCAQCHTGSHLTNNQSANVGTGANLQVPSLKGVRFRTPLMHDGCASTIAERFTNKKCGGGDSHGKTSQLNAAQISDLTAYLETL
jgi:mono/diheme cytochrome c family protein